MLRHSAAQLPAAGQAPNVIGSRWRTSVGESETVPFFSVFGLVVVNRLVVVKPYCARSARRAVGNLAMVMRIVCGGLAPAVVMIVAGRVVATSRQP